MDSDSVDWEGLLEGFQELLLAYGIAESGHELLLLVEGELDAQEDLLARGYEKTVIMRQSTFLESLLASFLQLEIEADLGHELSGSDRYYLKREVSPRGKVLMAYWRGVIEKQERDAFLELMSVRNTVAHSAWIEIEVDEDTDESDYNYQRIAHRIYDLLEEWAEPDLRS